jgi:hypothetical protein
VGAACRRGANGEPSMQAQVPAAQVRVTDPYCLLQIPTLYITLAIRIENNHAPIWSAALFI